MGQISKQAHAIFYEVESRWFSAVNNFLAIAARFVGLALFGLLISIAGTSIRRMLFGPKGIKG